jgi:6-phosphogluconolactonase
MDRIRISSVRAISLIVSLAILMCLGPAMSLALGRSGAVYVLTNQSTGNAVMVYQRAPDGTLSFSGKFSTGGEGAGTGADPLGSQGSLVLGRGHHFLYAANAGSNDVSVFALDGLNLHLIGRAASGGTMPVSIAVDGPLVYVLNAGGTPNIAGFAFVPFIHWLLALPNSTRNLPGGTGSAPADVGFSPDGSVLMVTEKNTNQIDTFSVDDRGEASQPIANKSSGTTPFGLVFTHGGFALVVEAGTGALSSYEVDESGDLGTVTTSLSDGQTAACWVVVTDDSRFAYVANAGSNTISSYSVSRDGVLYLTNPDAATTAAPLDMALSSDSRFLYVRNGTNMISGFRVEEDGSLTPVGSVGGIPPGSQGIAAR